MKREEKRKGREKGRRGEREGKERKWIVYLCLSPLRLPPPHSKPVLPTVLFFLQPFFLRSPLHKVTAARSTWGG